MNRANYLLVLSSAALISISIALNHKDCGTEIGKLKSFSLSGCDQREKTCPMYENKPRTIKVSFTPTRDVGKIFMAANTVVTPTWGPHKNIYVEVTNTHPCGNPYSGIKCPLKKDQTYNWEGQITATEYDWLQTDYTFYFRIRDSENWDKLLCMQFNVTKS